MSSDYKRFKLIGCKVMTREIGYLTALSNNYIDTTWLRQGYHNEPDKLREIIQKSIDDIENGDDPFTCNTEAGEFDAILLCYGLCSNGICGIKSSKYPIVIPRGHDCVTLLLGSKERYKELFDSTSGGTYWYSAGWIENNLMPSREREENALKIYTEIYGEDNAEYLLEMENGWLTEYKAAAFIEHEGINSERFKSLTKDSADYYNWEYNEHKGSLDLLKDFIDGNWDNERFLVVPPNCTIQQSFDNGVIRYE